MRKRRRLLIGVLIAALALAGCCLGPWGTSYPPLGRVTRIEVRDLSNNRLRVMDDPAEIQRVVEYIDGHRHGWNWMSGWAGVPVPQITAEFYDGSEFKGHFGVGPGFFECQREGDFASKGIWSWQERRFLELVGLPDYQLRK
ncbi:MAG: hypothetical protein JWO38_3045 [Gemmataceae bacterium]|nr:hypothetical protein [Gemmataceae bacterium]